MAVIINNPANLSDEIDISTDGARQASIVDEEVVGLLKQILTELKMMNFRLLYATEIDIDPEDVE